MGAILAPGAGAQGPVGDLPWINESWTSIGLDGQPSTTVYSHPQGKTRDTIWVDKTTYGLDEKVTIHYRIECVGSDAVDRMVGEWPPVEIAVWRDGRKLVDDLYNHTFAFERLYLEPGEWLDFPVVYQPDAAGAILDAEMSSLAYGRDLSWLPNSFDYQAVAGPDLSASFSVVPEPGTVGVVGCAGVWWLLRRRGKAASLMSNAW